MQIISAICIGLGIVLLGIVGSAVVSGLLYVHLNFTYDHATLYGMATTFGIIGLGVGLLLRSGS